MVKKEKSKSVIKKKIPLRVAGEKVSEGVERPSQRLFAEVKKNLEQEQVEEIVPPTTIHPLPPPTTQNLATSPRKDFTKVANSITRDVLPQGLFKGTSKGTYDALYLKTRGAIKPTRSIKAKQSDLQIWAGVSHNTLRNHLNYLQSIGLINVEYKLGDNYGAVYEVFLPEEVGFKKAINRPLPPPTTSTQNVGGPTYQELDGGGRGINPINIEQNYSSKTLLKTLNPDDEQTAAFADFNKLISEASERITGKKVSKKESKKWGEVAEILILELELAAARTETVSSVPAFLKEVLRRKLETKPIATDRKSGKVSKQMQVGKPDSTTAEPEKWEREVLTKEEREKTLQVMRERKAEGHLELVKSMEQTYTTEDWKWLMNEIGKD